MRLSVLLASPGGELEMPSARALRNEFQARQAATFFFVRRLTFLLLVFGSDLLRHCLLDFLVIHAIPLGSADQCVFGFPAATLERPIEQAEFQQQAAERGFVVLATRFQSSVPARPLSRPQRCAA
jgi:hypothetical protein